MRRTASVRLWTDREQTTNARLAPARSAAPPRPCSIICGPQCRRQGCPEARKPFSIILPPSRGRLTAVGNMPGTVCSAGFAWFPGRGAARDRPAHAGRRPGGRPMRRVWGAASVGAGKRLTSAPRRPCPRRGRRSPRRCSPPLAAPLANVSPSRGGMRRMPWVPSENRVDGRAWRIRPSVGWSSSGNMPTAFRCGCSATSVSLAKAACGTSSRSSSSSHSAVVRSGAISRMRS